MNKHKNIIIFINKVVDVRATILCQNKWFFYANWFNGRVKQQNTTRSAYGGFLRRTNNCFFIQRNS